MNILLLNAGSSSLKCTLMEAVNGQVIAQSLADWAGSVTPYEYAGPDGKEHSEDVAWRGQTEAVRRVLYDLQHTEPVAIAGPSPLYMSPEQASAYEEVDARADIYSLGAVAYYLLTGKPPFTGKNVLELLAAHGHGEVGPPSRLNPAVPADLDQIILKCLAKKPPDRFRDVAGVMTALGDCSVANTWGPEQAADWWQAIEAKLPAEEKAGTRAVGDVTQDYSTMVTLEPTTIRQVAK